MQSLQELAARRIPVNDTVTGRTFRDIEFPQEVIRMIKEGITFERLINDDLMNEKSNPLYFYEALNTISKRLPWYFVDIDVLPPDAFVEDNELRSEETLKALANKSGISRKQASTYISDPIKEIKKLVLLIYNNPGLLIRNYYSEYFSISLRDFDFCWDKTNDGYRLLFFVEEFNDISVNTFHTFDDLLENIITNVYETIRGELSLGGYFEVVPVGDLSPIIRKGYEVLADGFIDETGDKMDNFSEKLEKEFTEENSTLYIDTDINFGSSIFKNNTQVFRIGGNLLFAQPGTIDANNLKMLPMSIGIWMISITYPFNNPKAYAFIE